MTMNTARPTPLQEALDALKAESERNQGRIRRRAQRVDRCANADDEFPEEPVTAVSELPTHPLLKPTSGG